MDTQSKIFLVVFLAGTLSIGAPTTTAEQTLFFDNFDSYPEGANLSEGEYGGWVGRWGGGITASSEHSVSQPFCARMDNSLGCWASQIDHPLPYYPVIWISADIMGKKTDRTGCHQYDVLIRLFNPDEGGAWGSYPFGIGLVAAPGQDVDCAYGSGLIAYTSLYWVDGVYKCYDCANIEPDYDLLVGRWINTVARVDTQQNIADIWIDGVHRASLSMNSVCPSYASIALVCSNGIGYVDNVHIFLDNAQYQAPFAHFNYSPALPKVREWIKLDASSSYDPDGQVIHYEWDLNGDGDFDGFTTSPEIFYYWEESGHYPVTLRVTDNTGATDTFINHITIQNNSWWNKIKQFFASDIEKLNEEEKRRFQMIRCGLSIGEYPDFTDPTRDIYYWTDNQLLNILKSKIDPLAADLTYETLVLDTLYDMKLADSIAGRDWTANPDIRAYFEGMAAVNAWAETGLLVTKETFKAFVEAATGSSLGLDPILTLPDLCQAAIEIAFLDEVFYRYSLWYYFQNREMDVSPEVAFGSSKVPPKYKNEQVNHYFETLWTQYGGSNIAPGGGLKSVFKNQIIIQLRKLLISGREKYKFAPYQTYIVKSPVEVRVKDSQNRLTGLMNGQVKEEIPNSVYDGVSKGILIFDLNDSYTYVAVGSGKDTYGLDIVSLEDGNATTFTAISIPTSPNKVHQYAFDWHALSQNEEAVTLDIDNEGDGNFDRTISSDNNLVSYEVAIEPLVYELVEQRRVSRTVFEYTLRLQARNSGIWGVKNVVLQLVELPENTLALDDTVVFSMIDPGAVVSSDDTFKIRSDRSIEGLESQIRWKVGDCTEPRKADYNYDWSVDFIDLKYFAESWLCVGEDLAPDFYPDRRVDFVDFALFAEEWLK